MLPGRQIHDAEPLSRKTAQAQTSDEDGHRPQDGSAAARLHARVPAPVPARDGHVGKPTP